MKNLIDEFFFWVFLCIAAIVIGITFWVRYSVSRDLEMAKLGMCETPLVGSGYTRWQKCQ